MSTLGTREQQSNRQLLEHLTVKVPFSPLVIPPSAACSRPDGSLQIKSLTHLLKSVTFSTGSHGAALQRVCDNRGVSETKQGVDKLAKKQEDIVPRMMSVLKIR
ncbi:hypothetical protein ATANTOWER_011762 [Ataeniobius toweri]|uniref:Uncharacterized protein n=1 Tax=Ataeniobius toweri TaxID=208326 RepID=A0ABU7CGX1_9TELE|nr:hypothetical protein [Ataeniobius toweri]